MLEVYRGDVAEGNAKLERLSEKLAELEAQKQESIQAIQNADRKIRLYKNSTRVEVFRLKGASTSDRIVNRLNICLLDELEAMQSLHSWRMTKVQQSLLELVYENRFRVRVPCKKYTPITSDIKISRIEEQPTKVFDLFPPYSEIVLRMSQQYASSLTASNAREVWAL